MSKMKKPEMSVVRFKESDVIVASGTGAKTVSFTKLGNKTAGDGIATYNGVDYVMSGSAVDFLTAVGATTNAGINNGTKTISVNHLFSVESSGTGVSSKNWNGTYTYDANATWNNGTKDLKGVFTKQ